MRRVNLHQLGRQGEEPGGGHRLHLLERGHAHVHGRIGLEGRQRAGRLAPPGQRGDRETGLDLVHRVVVGRAVGLSPTDDPHRGCRGGQRGDSLRQRTRPAGRDQRVMLLPGPGGPPSRCGERVGPHVIDREHVVAAAGIGGRHDHRPAGQVQPYARIERVKVRPDYHLKIRGRERRDMRELAHRGPPRNLPGCDVGHLAAADLHGHQRVEVQIGLYAKLVPVKHALAHGLLPFVAASTDEKGASRGRAPTSSTTGESDAQNGSASSPRHGRAAGRPVPAQAGRPGDGAWFRGGREFRVPRQPRMSTALIRTGRMVTLTRDWPGRSRERRSAWYLAPSLSAKE